jgi:hypothetical protein
MANRSNRKPAPQFPARASDAPKRAEKMAAQHEPRLESKSLASGASARVPQARQAQPHRSERERRQASSQTPAIFRMIKSWSSWSSWW